MDHEIELIEVVRTHLKNCVNSSAEYYTYGNIPARKIAGAIKNYANGVRPDEVIGLIDTTVFGGGERGMLLTKDGIYLKEILSNPVYSDYENCTDMRMPDNTYYNTDNLFLMFMELSNIASQTADEEFISSIDDSGDSEESILDVLVHEIGKAFSAKRKQENEEFLEQLESLTVGIRDYRNALGEFIIDYDDIETYQEVAEKITTILLMACIADNDKNAFLRVTDSFDDNCEQMLEMIKSWKEILDEILEDSDKDGAETLTRTFKRFHTKMNTIYDELTASADDPDGEVDWEGLYERSQNAILTVRKKLSIVISIINEAMEEEFDD